MPSDHWIPACGETEPIFTVNGRRWQYCWNPATGQHRYLDVSTDRIVDNAQFHPTHAPQFEFECNALTASGQAWLHRKEQSRRNPEEVYFF